MRVRHAGAVLVVSLAVLAGGLGCSSEDSEDSTATSTTATAEETTTTAPEVLTILVSNDDGFGAPGIDAVVRALDELPDTEIVVVAPAENQSGSGSNTTEGDLEVTEVETASGFPVTAVAGFPADAVNWALDGGIAVTPDLVVTGINSGQNLGAVGDQLSGTVGAARAAAAAGIPAVATSTALNEAVDYDLAAVYVVEWVQENREALLAGELSGDALLLQGLNIPFCAVGEIRGVVEVPMSAGSDGAIADQDCTSTLEDPVDDITAFNNGFVSLSNLPLRAAA